MDRTAGQFTTFKLQSLLDTGVSADIHSRRDLAHALKDHGQSISIHGIEAWFRHVDSNYALERDSLSDSVRSYPIPQRRWASLLELFSLSLDELAVTDVVFREQCFHNKQQQDNLAVAALLKEPSATMLVGREAVRLEVLKAYEKSVSGHPRLVFLEGDAGVGKSCLLEALEDDIAKTDCLILSSSCLEGSDVPLLPLLDLFEMQLDQLKILDASIVERYRSLQRRVMDDEGRGQIFLAITAMLSELARQYSVVLIIDDLQWADESTCRFLEHLANAMSSSRDQRMLFIGASRPFDTDWVGRVERMATRAPVECLDIAALDEPDTEALLGSILKLPVDEDLSKWIWTMTLGNPLYVLQIVEHLQTTQQIDGLGHVNVRTLEAPENITTTYQIRYEALSEPTQQLLSAASALDYQFELAELQYVYGKFSTDVVVDCLEEAESTGLLIYQNDRFRFSHPLARHCIYGLLSESRKALIHYGIGERLQSKSSAVSPYIFIENAQHLLKGRICADAATLMTTCIAAARFSKQLDAWDKVIEFAQAAIELDAGELLTPGERSELLTLIGGGFHQSGDADAAIEHLTKAVEQFKASGNELEAARALTDISRIQMNFGKVGVEKLANVKTLVSYLPMLEKTDVRLAAWTMDTIASQYFHANQIDRANYFTQRSIDCLEHHEPCREQALVLISAGLLNLNQSQPLEAAIHFSKAELVAQNIKDDATAARCQQRQALAQFALGRCQEVIATVQALEKYRDKVSETGERSLALSALTSVHSLMEDFEGADAIYAEAMRLIDTTGYSWAIPNLIAAYVSSLVRQDRFDDARAAIERTDNLVIQNKNSFAGLRTRLELLVADREGGSMQEIAESVRLNPAGDGSELLRLPAYAMGLDLALHREDKVQIELGVQVMRKAHERGAQFVGGWPYCIPLLLARAEIIQGQDDVAREFLTLTIELADRADIQSVLREVDDACQDLSGDSTHLRTRLQRSLERMRMTHSAIH